MYLTENQSPIHLRVGPSRCASTEFLRVGGARIVVGNYGSSDTRVSLVWDLLTVFTLETLVFILETE